MKRNLCQSPGIIVPFVHCSIPFTIQRLCELLTNPKKHYKRTDKFMRGLEKVKTVIFAINGTNLEIGLWEVYLCFHGVSQILNFPCCCILFQNLLVVSTVDPFGK